MSIMPQVETVECKPNLTHYSSIEIIAMCLKYTELINCGRDNEAKELLNEIPLHWKSAKILKKIGWNSNND